MDPELGRCRRTDGKKWRCARDVAPDQKYCERHLHRSRPRSRKPVEAKLKSNASAAAASAAAANNTNNGTLDAVPMLQTEKSSATASSGFVPNIELNLPFQSEEPRCQDWMRSYSGDLDSNQQWELMHSKIGVKYNSNPVMQNYGHLPNLNYSYYTDDLNSDCCSFLNPNLPSYRDSHLADYREPPRRLIDAWSAENIASASKPMDSVSGRDKLPVSCLTLSMSNGIAEGTDNSPLGGPLAEAFQSTNGNSNCIDLINLMCKSSSSSSSRMVSSPSGVLQKTLVSLSDSSSSSSPTFAAVPRSEFAFEWMKQNK